MYTAVRTSGLVHKGGTLKVIQSGGRSEATFDPGTCYDTTCEQTLLNVYDGLVGYRRVGGIAGSRLAPDLALTGLPTPTDGGRTYTFRIRPRHPLSNAERRCGPDGLPAGDRTHSSTTQEAPTASSSTRASGAQERLHKEGDAHAVQPREGRL